MRCLKLVEHLKSNCRRMWLLLLSCIGEAFKSISMLGLMVEEWSILQHLRPHEGASTITQEHGCNSFSRRRDFAGPLLQMKNLSNPGMAASSLQTH